MKGLEKNQVLLVSFNPEWEVEFVDFKEQLIQIGIPGGNIVHVGSTAIHGLSAKPILDVLIGLPSLDEVSNYETDLKNLELENRGFREENGGFLFVKRKDGKNTHHVHIVEKNTEVWDNYLKFRDSLNANLTLRKQYEKIKLELAQKFPGDRKSYSGGKHDFIQRVLNTKDAP